MRTELHEERDLRGIVSWRRDQLVASGLTLRLASRLAHDPDCDLHALIELTEKGCPPELAVRILAPIDGGPAA